MPSASLIAHTGLPFANPMSEAAVADAAESLALRSGDTVLDTGCGDGEMLLRVLAQYPGVSGRGVDLDADAIASAADRAGTLPARFEVRDAMSVTEPADVVINVGASHALGGYPSALSALARLGPVVLYGEGFWEHAPSEAFLAALGGATADELSDLEGLRSAVDAAGFDISFEALATPEDWARYEETLAENAERHGTPETDAYARRIRDRRRLPDGQDTLGFALLVLRARP